jgi:hypothetical protein
MQLSVVELFKQEYTGLKFGVFDGSKNPFSIHLVIETGNEDFVLKTDMREMLKDQLETYDDPSDAGGYTKDLRVLVKALRDLADEIDSKLPPAAEAG